LPDTGFKYRDALRLLFILQGGARPLAVPDPETGAVAVFEGEKRLMAIDFLIRYPDYLANALLDEYEIDQDTDLLDQIGKIFDNEEPEVRVIKMLRWRRGAFDNIEDALSVLSSRHLIALRRKVIATGFQHDFFIFSSTSAFLSDAITEDESIGWYKDRMQLVSRITQFKSGSALKDMQYGEPEYKHAEHRAYIPSIKERVIARLQSLKAANP
jgi:hypothetical protein